MTYRRLPKSFQGAHPENESVDDKSSGINFVDILFALVIAKLLDQLSSLLGQFTLQEAWFRPDLFSHFAVASTLTVTSWIGYHASLNSPKFKMRFFNLPLFKFFLDISMVAIYWLAAISMESNLGQGEGARWKDHSAVWEAGLSFIGFIMYLLWDQASMRMKPMRNVAFWAAIKKDLVKPGSALRPTALEVIDSPQRRRTTEDLVMVFFFFFVAAWLVSDGLWSALLVDMALVFALFAFRDLKEESFELEKDLKGMEIIRKAQHEHIELVWKEVPPFQERLRVRDGIDRREKFELRWCKWVIGFLGVSTLMVASSKNVGLFFCLLIVVGGLLKRMNHFETYDLGKLRSWFYSFRYSDVKAAYQWFRGSQEVLE